MITLPDGVGPGDASPALLDYGFLQRTGAGGETTRIDRMGSRYRVAFSFGPFSPILGNVMVSRLLAAKSKGIRLPYPLLRDQGYPGSPLVDGAGQSGETLSLKGVTPGYACLEGYWISIEDQNGRHYLHNVQQTGVATTGGLLEIQITPMLRWPFLNNAVVHIAKPMVEGFVDGDEWAWNLSVNRVVPIEFTVEEAA
jgi:hypothetical protein